jgi:hypothetical protein
VDSEIRYKIFHLHNITETKEFLNELDSNENYVVTIEFIRDFYYEDTPRMLLSNPFLRNKFSSETNITKFIWERLEFMVDVYYLDDSILQDKPYKSNYYEINNNFEMEYFYNFITNLDNNSLFTVIPIISIKNNFNEPYMVLGKSILVTRYSSYKLIHHDIYSKYLKSLDDFGIDGLEDFHIILKYKKVKLNINQINKKFGK